MHKQGKKQVIHKRCWQKRQVLKVSTDYLLGIAKSGKQELKIIPDLSTEQKNFVIDTVRALMELL